MKKAPLKILFGKIEPQGFIQVYVVIVRFSKVVF